MLTDEELKKIQFKMVSHMSMANYYSSVYKSINVEPQITMSCISPRKPWGYEDDELIECYEKVRASKCFSCVGLHKGYARIATLNRHVELKLISVYEKNILPELSQESSTQAKESGKVWGGTSNN